MKQDLKAIGITVEVKQFPPGVLYGKIGTRGEPFDIADQAWLADYNDPFEFVNLLFDGSHIKANGNSDISYLDDSTFNRRLVAAAKLTGPERYRVYGQLDLDLARKAAPFAVYSTIVIQDFFSARLGCQVFQPVYLMDLGALCIRKRPSG